MVSMKMIMTSGELLSFSPLKTVAARETEQRERRSRVLSLLHEGKLSGEIRLQVGKRILIDMHGVGASDGRLLLKRVSYH
jgi:hypothetical protein